MRRVRTTKKAEGARKRSFRFFIFRGSAVERQPCFFHRGDQCGDDRFNDMGNELDIYGVQ